MRNVIDTFIQQIYDVAVFEGWYWRVTLPGNAKSFALIYSIEDPTGSTPLRGLGAQVMGPDDGYLCQYSKDISSFWADKSQLALGAAFRAKSVDKRPALNTVFKGMLPKDKFNSVVREGFQASSKWHQGSIVSSESGVAGEIASTVDTCSWEFKIKPITGWGDPKGRQRSTAGWLSISPIFEPHWQVMMSHGEATGWIKWGDDVHEFDNAPAYAEKNWGGGFPSRWAWIQCNTFLNSPGTSVTAVGAERGLMQIPGVLENVGLIGIHHEGQFYELNIKDGNVRWSVAPWGKWHIEAANDQYEATIKATCRPSDGTPLRAPTAALGLAPFCRDSFGGVVELTLWKAGGRNRQEEPLINLRSDGKSGAVEVGGGPWWTEWAEEAEMSEPVKQLLNIPIDVEYLVDLLPDQLRPPGL